MKPGNTYTQEPLHKRRSQMAADRLNVFIANYDKYRRYYFRDYDDRYQVDSYNEQQFERIFGNSSRPSA